MAAATTEVERIERDEVDVALEAWARWARSALTGLGWPSLSLIWKCIKFGVRGAAHTGNGPKSLEIDTTCELVDRAIMRLDDTEREVVMRTYLENDAAMVTAEKCQLTYQYYRNVLSRARRRVGDYLDGARSAVV